MPVGTVKSSTVGLNRDGTIPVRLLQVEITDADDIQTIELFTQAGEDYNPPVGSSVFIVKSGESWKIAIACDDGITPSSDEGERILYSSSGGVIQGQIYIKNDGTIEISNSNGSVELNPDGSSEMKNSSGNIKLQASGQVDINSGNLTVLP